jgi:hypothetical protein
MVLSLHSRDDFAGAGSIEMIARRYYLIPGWFRVALLPIFHRDTVAGPLRAPRLSNL